MVTTRPSWAAARRMIERTSPARRNVAPPTMHCPGARLVAGRACRGIVGPTMDAFIQLFGHLLVIVYHCFDRIVIHGYLSGLSRPEQVAHFFRRVGGGAAVDKEVLRRRTADYQTWVDAFAHNHGLPIEWAEKGVRKEDHVL